MDEDIHKIMEHWADYEPGRGYQVSNLGSKMWRCRTYQGERVQHECFADSQRAVLRKMWETIAWASALSGSVST